MYVCLFFINLICLNKVLFVIVVFSLEKCLWFWCIVYSNIFKLFNFKLNIIRCISCRMIVVGIDVNDMWLKEENGFIFIYCFCGLYFFNF